MLDTTKPIETKSGQSVVLLTTEGRAPRVLVGYMGDSPYPHTWFRDGSYYENVESNSDLVNVKTERSIWVNIFKVSGTKSLYSAGASYPSREAAMKQAQYAVDTVEVKFHA